MEQIEYVLGIHSEGDYREEIFKTPVPVHKGDMIELEDGREYEVFSVVHRTRLVPVIHAK